MFSDTRRGAGSPANIPTDYVPGYEKARRIDPVMASNYVEHTLIGDPLADAMAADLADLEADEASRFINLAMDDPGGRSLNGAPASLREFFREVERGPDWLDHSVFDPSIRMFHRNSYAAFVAILSAVLIEGYTTNIAKSFVMTGRTREAGIRRLGQNSRHVVEVFVPGRPRQVRGRLETVRPDQDCPRLRATPPEQLRGVGCEGLGDPYLCRAHGFCPLRLLGEAVASPEATGWRLQ